MTEQTDLQALQSIQDIPPRADALIDLNDDTPLAPVCDLSVDKTCESC